MPARAVHPACRVRRRLQEEMLETGSADIGLYPQRTVIHPRAYCAERIMIERVHPVVSAETVRVRVRIEPFPNRGGPLLHRIKPRRVGSLLQQPVSDIVVAAIRQSAANPRRADKSRHQRIGRAQDAVVGLVLPSHRIRQTACNFQAHRIGHNVERQRKHVGSTSRLPSAKRVRPV